MKYLFFVMLVLSFPVLSEQSCLPWQVSFNELDDLIIGKIDFNVSDIFDPRNAKEQRKFHKLANKWHVTTKQNIISRELLFKISDRYDQRLVQETERLIRGKSFIKSAEIYPKELCGRKVTVQVNTEDNWTLTPGISYGRTGGRTKWALELQEKNLFGFGKSLEFKYRQGLDRTQKSIKYEDDNLFGSRNRLDAVYEDNSDGNLQFFNLYRPFFSLDSKYTWDIRYLDNKLINPLYERGEIVDEIGQNRRLFSLSYGKLLKRTSDTLHRYSFGFTSDKSDFFPGIDFPNTPLPDYRSYNYPWVSYEFFQEDYIKRSNFNSMGRVEDISLGHHFSTMLGNSFSNSSLQYSLNYSKGFYNKENDLLLTESYFNGIYENGNLVNSHLGTQLKWFRFQDGNKTFFASLTLDKANNLFAENRQYLGGDTGLRGYPLRYLQGENKFLITVEQRYFYNWYPLKTFQFASAVFVDSGAAWNNNFKSNYVTNVGIGLRLVPTRTSSGKVLHLDIAVPIDQRDVVGNWQIQLRTKKSF